MAVPIRTRLVRMAKIRNGIMVRIERVATTKTDANRVPAVPTCSARCEVSIGADQKPKGGKRAIIMSAGAFDIRGKGDVLSGIWTIPAKIPRISLLAAWVGARQGEAGLSTRTTPGERRSGCYPA